MPGTEKITKVSIHEEGIFTFLKELNKEDCFREVHLIDERGNIIKGPDVITYLAKDFPGVSKIAWLLESQMGKTATKVFYNAVNKYRESLLNRCPKCKKSH